MAAWMVYATSELQGQLRRISITDGQLGESGYQPRLTATSVHRGFLFALSQDEVIRRGGADPNGAP